MPIRAFILLICLAFSAAPCGARDLYVNNVLGDDRNDGSVPEPVGDRIGPFRSITRALKSTQAADRVIVVNTGEAYRESFTLQGGRQSGIPGSPFELVGNGAVLDGTMRVPIDGWSHYAGRIFRYRPPRTSFQMLYLDGKPAQRQKAMGRDEIENLQSLEWCLFEGHLYFCVEENRLPQAYDLAFAQLQVGITLYEVRDVIIKDLVIQGFQLDGVNAHDGVRRAVLDTLNCRGNGRSGISVGGASRVVLQSCLVGNNGAAQVRTEGVSHAELIGCDLLDNTAPKIVRDGGEVVVNE